MAPPSLSKQTLTFSVRLIAMLLIAGVCNAQLSPNFYARTCPNLVAIVRARVRAVVLGSDPRMGASLLRLHFHDCFVQGCDASVLLDDTANFTGEKTAFPNVNSLRGFELIDAIKTAIETTCPNVVSCADILALAAREGTIALRGPTWTVGLGRRDSTTASLSNANSQIPAPSLNLAGLITSFANKGFTASQMVALSGAHTIGQASCGTFRTRIYNETNINPIFATRRRANCPITGGNGNLAPMDENSPNVFNNDYYRNLVGLRGLLTSDQQLFNNGSTDAQVRGYTGATGTASFFRDFAAAMVVMQNLTPLTGTNGQIRGNCRRIN